MMQTIDLTDPRWVNPPAGCEVTLADGESLPTLLITYHDDPEPVLLEPPDDLWNLDVYNMPHRTWELCQEGGQAIQWWQNTLRGEVETYWDQPDPERHDTVNRWLCQYGHHVTYWLANVTPSQTLGGRPNWHTCKNPRPSGLLHRWWCELRRTNQLDTWHTGTTL